MFTFKQNKFSHHHWNTFDLNNFLVCVLISLSCPSPSLSPVSRGHLRLSPDINKVIYQSEISIHLSDHRIAIILLEHLCSRTTDLQCTYGDWHVLGGDKIIQKWSSGTDFSPMGPLLLVFQAVIINHFWYDYKFLATLIVGKVTTNKCRYSLGEEFIIVKFLVVVVQPAISLFLSKQQTLIFYSKFYTYITIFSDVKMTKLLWYCVRKSWSTFDTFLCWCLHVKTSPLWPFLTCLWHCHVLFLKYFIFSS